MRHPPPMREDLSPLPRADHETLPRAAVVNVFRDGVLSNSDDPPLEGVPAVHKGRPTGGRFFPLLFDPDV